MNIFGYGEDNYHDGNTTINGNLFVDGKVYDAGGGGDIPLVYSTNHIGLDVYAGTNSATGGIVDITDLKQIIKKHGNWRIVSGNVTMSLLINGYSNFTIQFDSPVTGDIINNIYLNGGVSGAIGNTSPNFFASSVTQFGGIIKIRFITADKGLWPQNQSVFTNARYCISYITANSDPANEVLNLSSFIENPMIENLDGGNFNITNVNNIQATTFNGGQILSNPYFNDFNLNGDLNINEFNINQLASIQNLGLDLIINTSSLDISNTPMNILGTSIINMSGNNINNAGTIQVETITSSGFSIEIDKGINQAAPGFDNVLHLRDTSTTVKNSAVGYIFIETDDKQGVGAFGAAGDPDYIEIIAYPGRDIQLKVDNKNFNFTSTGSFIMPPSGIINTDTISTSNISAIGDMLISSNPGTSITIGNQAKTIYTNTFFTNQISERTQRRTESNSNSLIDTAHIYEVGGITEATINEGGFNYYQLIDNTTYIIHGEIELTQGFKFGINNVIKGSSTASSITFDESKNNIIGFKSTDQNLVIQDITIYGGGGHFSISNVGLFQGVNFDISGLPPFYGRNKRCLISGMNIVAPYSLGIIRGFGTVNILSNFINGGGGSATGIYTTFGLDVSDGLSFELRGNKMVLFKGAQASSTAKMIDFVNSTIANVGINAVIITGNILHPRDQEIGINFENGALVELGTISANTFIRTGGTAALIGYENQTNFDNYNVKSIEHFEISGNAGIIDSEPILELATGLHNQITSATFIDLSIPITSIRPLEMCKRFALKFIVTGVTGGIYQKGNYLESVTDSTKRGYIVDVGLLGVLYITDMSGVFPNLNNYREVNSLLTPTGVASTGLEIGANSDNVELYYFDRDPHDIQFGCQISYENDAKEREINFRFSKDTGSGYVEIDDSIIQSTNPRQDRGDSTSLIHLVRMDFGDLIKIEYRYVDSVNTTITRINWTGK